MMMSTRSGGGGASDTREKAQKGWESGEWRVESGEWRVESGEQKATTDRSSQR